MNQFLILRPSAHPLVAQAAIDCEKFHDGQFRKDGLPYWTHPREVVELLIRCGIEDPDMLVAGYGHDWFEDTPADPHYVLNTYGQRAHDLIWYVTDALFEGSRAVRKKAQAERLWNVPGEAQTIKCADLISNTRTIVQCQPGFAKVYLPEKRYVLDGLTRADPVVRAWAYRSLGQAEAALAGA